RTTTRTLRTTGVRTVAGRDRQDASFTVLGPRAERGPDRVAASGARGPARGRSRIRVRPLRNDQDHARAVPPSRRRTDRVRRIREYPGSLLTPPSGPDA